MNKCLQVMLNVSPASGGVFTTVQSYSHALTSLGQHVTSMSFDRGRLDGRPPGIVSVPASRLPGLNRYAFSWRAKFGGYEELVRDADRIFVHALYGYHFSWAATVARDRVPLFVVPHGALDRYCFTYRKARKRLWLSTFRSVLEERATIICATEYEKEEVCATITPAAVKVVAWPVSESLFTDEEEWASLNSLNQEPFLLLAGRLHPTKRTLETVRAFARLSTPGWGLKIVGQPSAQISVANLRDAAGDQWGKSIHYEGYLAAPDMARLYARASGVLLFSHGENFANVVAEAVSNGCPAFLSDRVGLGYTVSKNSWGEIFDIRNDFDCAEAIAKAIDFCQRESTDRRRCRMRDGRKQFDFAAFQAALQAAMGINPMGVNQGVAQVA